MKKNANRDDDDDDEDIDDNDDEANKKRKEKEKKQLIKLQVEFMNDLEVWFHFTIEFSESFLFFQNQNTLNNYNPNNIENSYKMKLAFEIIEETIKKGEKILFFR